MPVEPGEWLSEISGYLPDDPKTGLLRASYYTYLGIWHTVTSRLDLGLQIFDHEWDLLIILDACRVDGLRTIAPEFDWLTEDDIISVWSRGSGSHEWLGRTFTSDYRSEICNTAYTTPNGFAKIAFVDGVYPPQHPVPIGSVLNKPVNASDFALLDFAWNVGWDTDFDTVPPRYMTDRAIEIGRTREYERLIVHYYQPHAPFLSDALRENRPPTECELNPYAKRKSGELDRETIWSMYLDNLRYVLEETELLLNNINASTAVITSDHGEMLGELGVYSHPEGFPHPNLRRVPWVEVSGRDTQSHDPARANVEDIGIIDEDEGNQVQKQLEALGYRT